MRGAIALLILVLPLLQPTVPGLTVQEFGDGREMAGADFPGPGCLVAANLSLPAECHILKASLKVGGIPAPGDPGAYPRAPSVLLDDLPIWEFNATGSGALGRQDTFSDGTAERSFSLKVAGEVAEATFTLPPEAQVRSATVELGLRGEEQLLQLGQWVGKNTGDSLGKHVSDLGDINGDGFGDFAVGAPNDDTVAYDSGAACIYLGGLEAPQAPSMLLLGEGFNDIFGSTVSGAGDLNGDGYDDLIVGSPWNSTAAYIGGKAYLFFGGEEPDARADLTLSGRGSVDYLGMSVSGAGDVNGDGYDDVVIGAPGADAGGTDSGAACMLFGGRDMNNVTDLVLSGSAPGDNFGWSVSSAGDFNGDGYDDVIVGAYYNNDAGPSAGSAYLFYGGTAMDAQADLKFTGAAPGDVFGYSVSGAGDVNGDGYGDVIVGAMRNDSAGPESGRAYIYYGGSWPDSTVDVVMGGTAGDEFFGNTVSDAGDVNRDGFGDVLVGASWNDEAGPDYGSAHVFFGDSAMDTSPDLTFFGSEGWEYFGFSLSGAGDTNGDSYDEVLIGAHASDLNGANSGRALMYSRAPFLEGPRVEVAGKTIWKVAGPAAGSRDLPDFSSVLQDHLGSAPPAGSYGYGNHYIEVPVKLSLLGAGNITLGNLNVTYETRAPVPDFAVELNNYLAGHRGQADVAGNVTIPVRVSSASAGRLELSDLNITVDAAPALNREIWDLEMDEDSSEPMLLDLYETHDDDHDPDSALKFSVLSSTQGDLVAVGIFGGRYLSADALSGDRNDNWTGSVTVVVRCSDSWGSGSNSNPFRINVRDVNDPPLVTSPAVTEAVVGMSYEYLVRAVDAESDVLTYGLARRPEGMTLDPLTGRIAWTPDRPGRCEVSVSVRDGMSSTFQNFTIDVILLNKAPRFTSAPLLNGTATLTYTYQATAYDLDRDGLAYELVVGPGGMSVDRGTGQVLWLPGLDQAGEFMVLLRVTDGKGGEDRQEFLVTVSPVKRPAISIAEPSPGQTVRGSVAFTGWAARGTREIVVVEVRIDSGGWKAAQGIQGWVLRLDTGTLANGGHILEARAFDGTDYSDLARARFVVDNPESLRPDTVLSIALVVVLSTILLAAGLVIRRKGKRKKYDWG